jgi:hypothetical protein
VWQCSAENTETVNASLLPAPFSAMACRLLVESGIGGKMTKTFYESNADRDRATRIVAKSLYKELRSQGYDARQIVAVSTELLGLVTAEISEPTAATLEPATSAPVART